MSSDRKGEPDCYIGRPLRRREDFRFVRGEGRYVDDILPPRTAWALG